MRTVPAPFCAFPESLRARSAEPRTVGFLGTQREDKGFHLLPDICRRLLAGSNAQLRVHNSSACWMGAENIPLRQLVASTARATLNERPLNRTEWRDVLLACDVVVCPYDPIRYHASYSAVAVEAAANGIPIVVPSGTTMARLLAEKLAAGTTFAAQDASCIADATIAVLLDYAAYRDASRTSAARWAERHGPSAVVDELLRLASECSHAEVLDTATAADLSVVGVTALRP